MKEYVMIPFQVQEDKIEEAGKIVHDFVAKVRAHEPGTLYYTSLQRKDDPSKFVHFMIFADNAAHQRHRSTPYVVEFVKNLYPLCPHEPFPMFLEDFDSCGRAIEALEGK